MSWGRMLLHANSILTVNSRREEGSQVNKTVTVESGTSIEEKADLGGQVGREEEEFTQNMRHTGTCLQVSP